MNLLEFYEIKSRTNIIFQHLIVYMWNVPVPKIIIIKAGNKIQLKLVA